MRAVRPIVLALMATTLSASSGLSIARELAEGLPPDVLAVVSGVLGLIGWIALIVLADKPANEQPPRRPKR